MKLFNQLKKHTKLMGATISSLIVGVAMMPFAASANPVTQYPSQEYGMSGIITIPSTGKVVSLSDINVVGIPPYPQNPCRGIYYEYPYNHQIVVPQVCQQNEITEALDQMGMLESVRAMGEVEYPYQRSY